MNAVLLSSGNELMTGDIIDSNAAWLADRLTHLGLSVTAHLTVGDEMAELTWAVSQALTKADLIVITGGIGPTPDDLTRYVLADLSQSPLIERPELIADIEAFFAAINRPMAEINRVQALIPQSARGLANPVGTAPGINIEIAGRAIFALPGVPREMKVMFDNHVAPWIASQHPVGLHRVHLQCMGMGESDIVHTIRDLITMDPAANSADAAVHFGTRAHNSLITVKLTGHDAARVDATASAIRQRLGNVIFGEGETTLPEAVGQLLRQKKQTVVTAESCTGGGIGAALTEVSGSSDYVLGGWIVYSNEYKTRFLNVPESTLAEHGAVSEPTARAMVAGALANSTADWALAVTGIAGPTGGTDAKPVGTVVLAVGNRTRIDVQTRRFGSLGRELVRLRAQMAALNMLRLRLLEETK